jgi:hypothetical protein
MRVSRLAAVAAAIFLIASSLSRPAAAADVSFGFFYSNLSPYGSWVVSASYGRVWQPSTYTFGWNPYHDGHWVYTEFGWTWVSDYPWGAIPYHYGTWVYDPAWGWVWVPGYTVAPAWVVFCTGPDYIGWAPVHPGFSIGVSVSFADYDTDHFVFVSAGDFLAPRIRAHVVRRSEVIIERTKIVNNMAVENNVIVNRGPGVTWVEQVGGVKVKARPIERVPRVGRAERVDAVKVKKGLRAAEPVSANEPLPTMDRRAKAVRAPTLKEPATRPGVPGRAGPAGKPERPRATATAPGSERDRARSKASIEKKEDKVATKDQAKKKAKKKARAQDEVREKRQEKDDRSG